MKRILTLLITSALLFSLAGCAGGYNPNSPKLFLNGKRLSVYTAHYGLTEEYAVIPLEAFLRSVGAEFADSSLNEYGRQCYSFFGKRYVVDKALCLFMLEEDYLALLEEFDSSGKALTQEAVAGRGLIPRDAASFSATSMSVDHVSLERALTESGIDITIEYSYSKRTISVALPDLRK